MKLPFGAVEGDTLVMDFSTADYSIAAVLAAVREHLDKLQEMDVQFLGAQTDVPSANSPVFKPVAIKAIFRYDGKLDPRAVLERTYRVMWEGLVGTFPAEKEWAESKQAFGQFIVAQADLLRARTQSTS